MKRWMAAAVITLAVTGCSESPQQRATRISQECEAIAEEVDLRIKPLSPTAKRNMVAECVFERGKGGSRAVGR